jgi:hypothetical protein
MRHVTRLIFALAISGCATRGLDALDDADGGMPMPGIYDYTVLSASDTCQPPRFVGPFNVGQAGVDTRSSYLSVQVPSYLRPDPLRSSFSTVTLNGATGSFAFHEPCALDDRQVVLKASAGNAFLLESTETWSHVTSGCQLPPPVTAECSATIELRYDLVQACLAPCAVVPTLTAAGGVRLTCKC